MERSDNIDFSVIDPIVDPLWENLVRSHPEGGIFHHPAWLELLRDQYHFKIVAVCGKRNDIVVAGIPFCTMRGLTLRNRWVCLPFSDHCGPLAFSAQDLRILLEHIRSEAAYKKIHVQVRSQLGPGLGYSVGRKGWLHVMNIDGDASYPLNSFKPRVRRAINKISKLGLTTEIRRDAESVDIFWRLHLLSRRRQGVPIQPRGYFEKFFDKIIAQDLGFVSLSRYKDCVISAGVFCTFKNVITYKYGASDPSYREMPASYSMLWEAMRYAKQRGFSIFDFGKTDASNEGLRRFKSGWASRQQELRYSYYPSVPCRNVFTFVENRLAKPLIRHGPTFVCRYTGELMYKYFGA